MLTTLHISNYALIEHLELDLKDGFSVITGETGAGKSIILGALGLLQGQRADAKTIKNGASKCIVEGVFTTKGLGVETVLQEADVDMEDDTLVVRREITVTGKSRTFINDTPVNLSLLREVSGLLIDIHSQHQNLLLSRENFLLDTLDCVAGNTKEYEAYIEAYRVYTEAVRELEFLKETARRGEEEQEFLSFQLRQLDEAQLQKDEQEELEEECTRLSHAEEIKGAFFQTISVLQSDENDVVAALRTASSSLESVSRYISKADELAERLNSVRIEVDDILSDVERMADGVDFNPERLMFVNDRLSIIYALQKKHRLNTIGELLTMAEELRGRLDELENADERLLQAEKAVKTALLHLEDCGEKLTLTRKKAATEVENALVDRLQSLGMPYLQLMFDFEHRPRPDRTGFDSLRFLFSANKKVAPQDVAQTASGGEIARLMLSLKALIAQKKNLPTIIFDEIDTGVSGTMAERMGRVMQQMGANAQVICITHLPQIAALGSAHYRVHKQESEAGTTSHISPLSPEQRVNEIANMLSGAEISEAAFANARELLRGSV